VKSFLVGQRPSAVAYWTVDRAAPRLPPYTAAALAVWLQPNDPRRLMELAYANDALNRWCEPPVEPQRHFAPILCERAALAAALARTATGAQAATALEAWEDATPPGVSAPSSGGNVTLRGFNYKPTEHPDELALVVTLDPGATPPDASLLVGGLPAPIRP